MNCKKLSVNHVSSDTKSINDYKGSASKRGLFGRRQGRTLSPTRARSMDNLLPKLEIKPDQLTEDHSLCPKTLFNDEKKEYWLELGFGHGEHVTGLMEQAPQNGFLAIEPFINGMSAFLLSIEKASQDNIRVLMDDGMILMRSLKENSLDRIYILNPDPWHKKRHHKRRIINHKNLDIFAKALKPGGTLILTSDVEDLAEWMCTHTTTHPEFQWQASSKKDWHTPPENWIPTRYETKGAKGAKKMVYMTFTRL